MSASALSAFTHLDAFTSHVTRFSGDSGQDLSTALLYVSLAAMAASGLGLIVLCARALLRRRVPPTQPWISRAFASPTIHTRRYLDSVPPPAPADVAPQGAAPPVVAEVAAEDELQPLSGPEPVTLRRPVPASPVTAGTLESPVIVEAPVPAAPLYDDSPISNADGPGTTGFGPSSTDPTVEMDMRAFASYTSGLAADNDATPSSPPVASETASSASGEVSSVREPILLLSRKRDAHAPEIPPPPPVPADLAPPPSELTQTDPESEPVTAHKSGSVPRANPVEYFQSLRGFTDGARRA